MTSDPQIGTFWVWLRCEPCDVSWKSDFDKDCWVCGKRGQKTTPPHVTSQHAVMLAESSRSGRVYPMPDQIIRSTHEDEEAAS